MVKIEPTLWNKAFAGQARASRCKEYCFSLAHVADNCEESLVTTAYYTCTNLTGKPFFFLPKIAIQRIKNMCTPDLSYRNPLVQLTSPKKRKKEKEEEED